MKPLIIFLDDEPLNLTVFEAALSSDWDFRGFDKPMEALAALDKLSPAVIVSDQRMPGSSGVQFLELAQKLHPDAVRIIVTGYSDQTLVIDSVRKAQIFDYITKPWDADDLLIRIQRAVGHFQATFEAKRLQSELIEREKVLAAKNAELLKKTDELQLANARELALRSEIECWVPRPLLEMLRNKAITFPLSRDIVGIAFDIVGSSKIHGLMASGKSVREQLIHLFSQSVMKNGGWRESHSGDSAYGHFGLWENTVDPSQAALHAAQEFRLLMRTFSQANNISVECGIALHLAKNSIVNVHTVQIETQNGPVIQKSFDTTSIEIDLLHRMEKLVHELPGSNIIMSETFRETLKITPVGLCEIGEVILKGQSEAVKLWLIKSDLVSDMQLVNFQKALSAEIEVFAA